MMGRGYWLPPGAKALAACDGYYIDLDAAYDKALVLSENWERFLYICSQKLMEKDGTFHFVGDWKDAGDGRKRFVLAGSPRYDVVVEEDKGYLAVFLLIPEDCKQPGRAKRSFPTELEKIKQALTELYPGHVHRRIHSREIEPIG
ncbi:hypothetical protein [Solibaculum intestinale]|uniref:Uncharacterized protein n=1 Tax=Solibaculum intestinale TaxID=3133165 RepID=A0ABV1E370_9FIRM